MSKIEQPSQRAAHPGKGSGNHGKYLYSSGGTWGKLEQSTFRGKLLKNAIVDTKWIVNTYFFAKKFKTNNRVFVTTIIWCDKWVFTLQDPIISHNLNNFSNFRFFIKKTKKTSIFQLSEYSSNRKMKIYSPI